MGIDYRVAAANGDWQKSEDETAEYLMNLIEYRRLPGFVRYICRLYAPYKVVPNSTMSVMEFRFTDEHSDWPDVSLHIKSDGLQICDHGGGTSEFWASLILDLAGEFDEPGISIYEL